MFDTDVGVNWHLRLRLKIEELQERVDYLNMKNRLLRNKIKSYTAKRWMATERRLKRR